ncbi:MAG: hypothetical protein U0573_04775 [Phycisphaerales bacterium]|nr:hypothetical protein [Planctomycetota bacterium]
MGCILVILALCVPRLTLFCLWLFGDSLTRAFPGGLFWPLLGFFFLPYTTLACTYANLHPGGGALNTVLIILAVLMDLGSIGGSSRHARKNPAP